jgi:hypothetical protein
LEFQTKILGQFQRRNNIIEQERLVEAFAAGGRGYRGYNEKARDTDVPSSDRIHLQTDDMDMDEQGDDESAHEGPLDDDVDFAEFARRVDNMYRRTHEGGDDEEGGIDADRFEDDVDISDDDRDEMPPLPKEYLPKTFDTAAETSDNPNIEPSFHIPPTDIPQVDALNNPYVRVIHTNGVHHIGLVYCTCRGIDTTHADLMAAGLVPTSFTRYKTLFTHSVLDDFRLSNLECKASAYQYFQKLRRQTSPMSPESVTNLYHELRRMSRLWRWMKKLKWAGMAHRPDFTIDPKPGELANFCAACPQPGINLPDDWSTVKESER